MAHPQRISSEQASRALDTKTNHDREVSAMLRQTGHVEERYAQLKGDLDAVNEIWNAYWTTEIERRRLRAALESQRLLIHALDS